MNETVTAEKLTHYFAVTKEALRVASEAPRTDNEAAAIIIDMASRYVRDAEHFARQGERVLAFAALNYAHGWLDSGARLGTFVVDDDTLFTVDTD